MITTKTSLSQVAVADLRSKQPLEHPGPADHTFYFLLADEEEGASFNLVNIASIGQHCKWYQHQYGKQYGDVCNEIMAR